MSNDNVITVIGNLTADPELRHTQNGVPVANITIAQTKRTRDNATGEWKDESTTFFRASVWREQGEHVAQSLTKGQRVFVTGAIRQRDYLDKDGVSRTSFELEVDDIGPSLRYGTTVFTKSAKSNQATAPAAQVAPADSAWAGGNPVSAPAPVAAPAPAPVGVSASQTLTDDAF
jgi:single-strand DNA-binding protein